MAKEDKHSVAVGTSKSLARDLVELGLPRRAVVIVHTSLKAVGRVDGGPAVLIAALRRAVGPQGTIVMPTHTSGLTDPALWRHPPAPREQWDTIRAQMPVYNPATSPTRKMGVVSETFWRMPAVKRSAHPVGSVAAQGPQAEQIIADHSLDLQEDMGPKGPLGRIYDLDGWVLLIGVDMRRNTSIHLAEVLAQVPHWHPFRVPVRRQRRKVWIESGGHAGCSASFERLTPLLDARGIVQYGTVGAAASRLMRQRPLVDTAERLLRQDPLALLCVEGSCETCDRARAFLDRRPSFDDAAAWVWPGEHRRTENCGVT